jgi:hypothetical protein
MTPASGRIVLAAVFVAAVAAPLHAADLDRGVARRLAPEEVQRRIAAGAKPIILDTRASLGDDKAKGAVHVPNDRIEAWAKDVPKDALIVAYCT